MNSIYIFFETHTNGYIELIISLVFLVSVLSGIFVIISKNPIISVLFLIGLFLSIALYLIILGISFIGLSYLLVYVGAVSILFIFILMLINIRVSELLSDTSKSIPLAIFVAIIFNYSILKIFPYLLYEFFDYEEYFYNYVFNNTLYMYNDYQYKIFNYFNEINLLYFATSSSWDINLSDNSDITSIGNIMYTSYSLWLIITSIILLLAMIGAIVITIKQKGSGNYNKYFSILKSDISLKTIQIYVAFTIGNYKYKSNNLYDISHIKLEFDNLLINLKSIIPNFLESSKSNINFEIIDKINIINKLSIKFNYLNNKLCYDLFFKNKINIPLHNISVDYMYNNIFTPINKIIILYPNYIMLPILIILLPIVLFNNNNNIMKVTNSTNDDCGTEAQINTDGESNTSYKGKEKENINNNNNNNNGGNGGEDPNHNKKNIFFLLKDSKRIFIPYNLYKEYKENLDMFLTFKHLLREQINLLNIQIENFITINNKPDLHNLNTSETNEIMRTYLNNTEQIREEIITLTNEFIIWQNSLQESISKLINLDSSLSSDFNQNNDLIQIGVNEMDYYSIDDNLFNIVKENTDVVFTIVDNSIQTSNSSMVPDFSQVEESTNAQSSSDPLALNESLTNEDIVTFFNASLSTYEANIESESDSESDLYSDSHSDYYSE